MRVQLCLIVACVAVGFAALPGANHLHEHDPNHPCPAYCGTAMAELPPLEVLMRIEVAQLEPKHRPRMPKRLKR